MKLLGVFLAITLLLTSCKTKETVVEQEKNSSTETTTKQITLSGILRPQGMTTYQYGTHVLKANGKTYALKSKSINLGDFIEKSVEITGDKIDGYPISGGPEYINVTSIKEKK